MTPGPENAVDQYHLLLRYSPRCGNSRQEEVNTLCEKLQTLQGLGSYGLPDHIKRPGLWFCFDFNGTRLCSLQPAKSLQEMRKFQQSTGGSRRVANIVSSLYTWDIILTSSNVKNQRKHDCSTKVCPQNLNCHELLSSACRSGP